MVVLLKNGQVHLLLLGALKAGCIDLSKHVLFPQELEVYDVRLSGNFDAIYALVRHGQELNVLHFQNPVFKEYMSPMMKLAQYCANILETKK